MSDDDHGPDPQQLQTPPSTTGETLKASELGSGLIARQSSQDASSVAVRKVCPQCGKEYETTSRFCLNDGAGLRPIGTDSLLDRVLGDRYHILKRIGEGGMGRVYLGEHVKMRRQCAVKVMSPALVNDAESVARFSREASNAARIIHPNVAAVFDFGESDGLVYLVMEFVEGQPLSQILGHEAPLDLARAIDLTRQIADGLGAAHELGIVHRDLKPDNILVMKSRGGKDVAKVVDFGIAKAAQESSGEGLTRTGHVIGTPEFMSPEQLLGDPIDQRSDLYAMGCVLYLMLTGSPPFRATTREQMVKRRLAEDAPSVHDLDPTLPDSLATVVSRLLARSPGDRYASASEVREALAGPHVRRAGAVRPSLVNRYTPRSAPTVAFLQATEATTEVTRVPPSQPARRFPAAVVGLMVLGGGALLARSMLSPATIVTPPAVHADSIKPATVKYDSLPVSTPVVSAAAAPAATVPASPGVPMVDSAKQKAIAARRHADDSVANAVSTRVLAAHAAIARYRSAIESGDIGALRAALPAMTPEQQQLWQNNFFAHADHIDATVKYGDTKISGDSADVDFSLALNYVDKVTKQTMTPTLRHHARVARNADGWQIVSLR